MPQPIAGKLSAAITELVDDLVRDIGRDDIHPIHEYLEMLTTSPLIGATVEVVVLLGLGFWGDYTHPDPTIKDFIQQNFEQMHGSLTLSLSELLSVKPLGYAASEWSIENKPSGWMLDDIQILHPKFYTFEGTRSGIVGVKYRTSGDEIQIPYDRLVHVVNQRHVSFRRPTGVADCKRAIAAWKAWKIIINEMLVAGQRQAVPIIVGYSEAGQVPLCGADGRSPLLDADGNPITLPATKAMLDQLENIENRAIVSTDIKNRIEALHQQTDGHFFFQALKMLQQMQLLAFLVPESVLAVSGTGDSHLNKGHRTTLDSAIRTTVSQIAEEVLEKVVRPLIAWNFGEKATADLGKFQEPETENDDRVALLDALANAVEKPNGTGFMPADLETINRGRELAGIPATATLPARMEANAQAVMSGNGNGRSRESRTSGQQTRTAASDDETPDDAALIDDWHSAVQKEYSGVIDARDDTGLAEGITTLWLFSVARGLFLRPGRRGKRKALTHAELETLMNDRIQVSKERLDKICDRYYAKTITLAAWYAESLTEIRLLHSELFAIGVGGLDQRSKSDRDALQKVLTFQEDALTNFRAAMALPDLESPSEVNARGRLGLYALSAWTAYKIGERSAAVNRGMKFGKRSLDPKPHVYCADCEVYAGKGWVKIAALVMPGQDCECCGNCRCKVEYAEAKP